MKRAEPLDFRRLSQQEAELAGDLLIGAEAIARAFKWRSKNGEWNTRRVYHLAEQPNFPIHHVKGLRICARRSLLL